MARVRMVFTARLSRSWLTSVAAIGTSPSLEGRSWELALRPGFGIPRIRPLARRPGPALASARPDPDLRTADAARLRPPCLRGVGHARQRDPVRDPGRGARLRVPVDLPAA